MAMRYNNRARRTSADAGVFGCALRQNPLLTAAAGTALIVGGCTGLGNAFVLCIMMLVILPIMGIISAMEMERIRYELRLAAYCGAAALLVFILSMIIDSIALGSVEALGVYAPLAAFSSLVLARTDDNAPILTRREAVYEGFAYAVSFAAAALPVGFIREIAGDGSLLGNWLGFSGIEEFGSPWMGYILCALAIAAIRRATDKPERIGTFSAEVNEK